MLNRIKEFIPKQFRPVFSKKIYFIYQRNTAGNPPALSSEFEVIMMSSVAEAKKYKLLGYKFQNIDIFQALPSLFRSGTTILFIFSNKEFAHYSCITESQKDAILDSVFSKIGELDPSAGVIGPCHTSENFRGKSLYPTALKLSCAYLEKKKKHIAFINTKSNNVASQKGILKAEFKLFKQLTLLTVFGRNFYAT